MCSSQAAESFRGLLLRHRARTGLIQRDLAARAGVSRRSVQEWETGAAFPSAERLQALIRVLLEAAGLTAGREALEARELWTAVRREAPRMHTPFDEQWFAGLLAAHAPPTAHPRTDTLDSAAAAERGTGPAERAQYWGDAPDTVGFVGRAEELAQLRHWVLEERCRLVAVLGIGGIGKTSIAAMLAENVAPSFERVYWRALRDAPPPSEWLVGAIGFLSDQQLVPPKTESERLTVLLQLLRERRCLLVLDNFETLFEPGQQEGRYRAGLAGYGRLLQAVGEAVHQSCLVLTSREAPPELAVRGDGRVRTFELGGLRVNEAQVLLGFKQLEGSSQDWAELNARFGGNSLALKIVGESIREVFGRSIGEFLEQAGATSLFGGIRRLLFEQIERSSPLEQQLLRVMAVEREPVRLTDLLAAQAPRVGRGAVLEAAESLRRRSLMDRVEMPGPAAFTLQSVVLEYVTDRLVEDVSNEIARHQPVLLVEQPLIKAQAKDYVRQTQERLIGAPILGRLKAAHGEGETEQRLLALLNGWRGLPTGIQGYGPGNMVNLLRLLRGHLRKLDLSRLAVRQAYLAQVDVQDASLVNAQLADTVLAEAFDFPGSVALSGDGALLAAGTSTGQVCLWRMADRTPLWAVQGHSGGVWGVALSGDCQLLASGGTDGAVRLWETTTGQPLTALEGHTGTVYGVALSANGELLASGGADSTVRLWDTRTGQQLATLPGHTGAIFGVAVSCDGQVVASGGGDGTVRLWDVASRRPMATLQGHTGTVWGVALSADGQLLASVSVDGTVRLWDTSAGRPGAILEGHAGEVYGVALSADGQLLASSGADGTLRLWDTRTGRPQATLQGHTGAIYGIALSADGELLASGGTEGTVRLWETATGRPQVTLQGLTGAVYGVVLSSDGRLLASAGTEGTVRRWVTSTGEPLASLEGHSATVYGMALSTDGQLLASGATDGTVRLWAAATGQPLATLEGNAGGVRSLALSADAQLLASGGTDGTVRLWKASTGQPVRTLEGHAGAVYGVALSADGEILASGGTDGSVRLFETTSGQALARLEGHTGAVYGVALSSDGVLLASGGGDGTVRLWVVGTGEALATLQGHTGAVYGVAISADGQLLASGGGDGTVRLWETGTGQCLATLRGHTGAVYGVALSADRRQVASGGFDGTVRLWEASTGSWLRTLRAERRYERLDITGLSGITGAQRQALLALGAVDRSATASGV